MEINRKKITNPDELDINLRIQAQEATAQDFLQKANIHFEKNEFVLAIENFTKVIQTEPSNTQAYYGRALSYHQSKQIDLALKDYAQVIKITPNHAECFFNRGIAYYTKGSYDIAIFDFTKAISISPDPDFYYNRALAYERSNKHREAISDLNVVIKNKPNAEKELFKRANLYLKIRQTDAAKQDFQAVKALNPSRSRECDLLLLAYLEEEQQRQKEVVQAQAFVTQVNQAESLKNQAEMAIVSKKYQNAIQFCNQALQIVPNDYQIYIHRGNAHLKMGNQDLATADFTKACALNSSAVAEIAALGITNLAVNWLKKFL